MFFSAGHKAERTLLFQNTICPICLKEILAEESGYRVTIRVSFKITYLTSVDFTFITKSLNQNIFTEDLLCLRFMENKKKDLKTESLPTKIQSNKEYLNKK